MRKKAFALLLFISAGFLAGLPSCSTNNNNPTVPLPIPTDTPTYTPTLSPTPTITFTPTFSNTPVACNTQVVLTEAQATPTAINANVTYVDKFNLPVASDINAVTVGIFGAGATGTGNNLQVAIYSDSSNYPGQVLFTSAIHLITATGPATYIFNPTQFSLPAGNYWLALHSSVQYQPEQNTGSLTSNYAVNGHLPNPYTAGAAPVGAPWSYSLSVCNP